jgi:tRNA A37 methylthiotransferase MiaB
VPDQVITHRARELRSLGERKKAEFQTAQIGRAARVLTLKRSGNNANGSWTRAISSNFLNVNVPGMWPPGKFLDVRITACSTGTLACALL